MYIYVVACEKNKKSYKVGYFTTLKSATRAIQRESGHFDDIDNIYIVRWPRGFASATKFQEALKIWKHVDHSWKLVKRMKYPIWSQ